MSRRGWRRGFLVFSAILLAGFLVADMRETHGEELIPAGMPEFVEPLPEEAGIGGEPIADLPPEQGPAAAGIGAAVGQICVLGSLVAGALIVLGLQMYGPGHKREDGCA